MNTSGVNCPHSLSWNISHSHEKNDKNSTIFNSCVRVVCANCRVLLWEPHFTEITLWHTSISLFYVLSLWTCGQASEFSQFIIWCVFSSSSYHMMCVFFLSASFLKPNTVVVVLVLSPECSDAALSLLVWPWARKMTLHVAGLSAVVT